MSPDLDFRWDITSEEACAPEFPQIDETDEERAERFRQDRIQSLVAQIEVEPYSCCIRGYEFLAQVPGEEDRGYDAFGPTPEEARENLIDWLWTVAA